jgi:hypothetical protein
MLRRALLIIGAAMLLVAPSVEAARTSHQAHETYKDYFSGLLSPGQGRSGPYDSQQCNVHGSGTGVAFSGYGWATAAVIDANGGWRVSKQGSVSGGTQSVYAFITPDTAANSLSYNKKSYCVNSGSGDQVLNMLCRRYYWLNVEHIICV